MSCGFGLSIVGWGESCCLGQNKDSDAKGTSKSVFCFPFYFKKKYNKKNNTLVNRFSLL